MIDEISEHHKCMPRPIKMDDLVQYLIQYALIKGTSLAKINVSYLKISTSCFKIGTPYVYHECDSFALIWT